MRSVVHPGPVANRRVDTARSEGREIEVTLAAGVPLEQAVAEATRGYTSAWLEIQDAPVAALDYVIPAPSPDDDHVAWYSDAHSFGGPGRIDHLGMIVGRHKGASFLHGHGLWTPEGAPQAMGHILAPHTVLAAPATARGVGLTGAVFDRLPDPETNFELFQVSGGGSSGDYAAVRLRPNQDFATALDAACAELGWTAARVHGLGSLIGAQFENGAVLDSLPSEFLITDAIVGVGGPAPEIVIVGIEGSRILSGLLTRSENAVLITAEIVLCRIES
ncbi:MAG: DUF296 domain-containing protein [Pseudomonadota bacterium]